MFNQPWCREYRRVLLEASEDVILDIADQLLTGYQMKRTMRYRSTRDHTVHSESNAEHEWALHYLTYFFLPLEDLERKLDQLLVHRLVMFHDFPEIKDGDYPYHLKTEEHREQEKKNAPLVFSGLPVLTRGLGHRSWMEFDTNSSPEARFVDALDKIEPLFELRHPVNVMSIRRLGMTYEQHISKKLAATEHFPVMRRFVDAMSNDMLRRDVFCAANEKGSL